MDNQRVKTSEYECMICMDKKWLVINPLNVVAPCPVCSKNMNLTDVEKLKGMRLIKNEMNAWVEFLLN